MGRRSTWGGAAPGEEEGGRKGGGEGRGGAGRWGDGGGCKGGGGVGGFLGFSGRPPFGPLLAGPLWALGPMAAPTRPQDSPLWPIRPPLGPGGL